MSKGNKPNQNQKFEVIDPASAKFEKQVSLKGARTRKLKFWDTIKDLTVQFFIDDWLSHFELGTREDYAGHIKRLTERGLLNIDLTLEVFKEQPHERILDEIKRISETIWKEATKQAHAAAYLSFTGYLQRLTEGIVRKAIPSKHGATKTFKKVREKVASHCLVQREWLRLLDELQKINSRDSLIIKMCLHGGKRISEVLNLTVTQIDFLNFQVTFLQSKTRGTHKEVMITYPQDLMEELKMFIGERTGLVFTTIYGKKAKVHVNQINRNLKIAAKRAGIEKKISSHVFRTSLITYLRSQGYPDSEIMKVTGHASSAMVAMYDKTSQADNPTKSIRLWG